MITGTRSNGANIGEQMGYLLGVPAFAAHAKLYPYERIIGEIWAGALCPQLVNEKNVLTTQSPGIALEKLGSLWVQSIHQPDAYFWVTPFDVDNPFPVKKLTVHAGGVGYHPQKCGTAIAWVVSGYAGEHDRFISACMTEGQRNPGFQFDCSTLSAGLDETFNREPLDVLADARRMELKPEVKYVADKPTMIYHFRSTTPQASYGNIRGLLRLEDEALEDELLVVSAERPTSGLYQLGLRVSGY